MRLQRQQRPVAAEGDVEQAGAAVSVGDEVKQIFERLGGTSSMVEIQDNLDKAPDKASLVGSLEDWLFGGCGGDAASSTIGGLGSRGEVPCKATSRTIPPLPPSP